MIKTHLSRIPNTNRTNAPHFHLTEIAPRSDNIEVRRYPKRIIAWGLQPNEQVSVHMVRLEALGNPHWALSDEECPCPIEPAELANVQSLPYQQQGKPLVLTAEQPAAHINNAGIYFFEYHGSEQAIIDHYDDPVLAKYPPHL